MNCIDFRRHYTIEPRSPDAELASHRGTCAACARFAGQMDSFEEQLRQAMAVEPPASMADRIWRRIEREAGPAAQVEFERHLGQALRVEIPEGLEKRILRRQAMERERSRRRWHLSLAAAAGLLAAVGLFTTLRPPVGGLGNDLIAHVDHEPQALMSRLQVDRSRLEAMLGTLGVQIGEDIGQVTYAGLCEIRRTLGAHLVLAGRHGPITVLILPAEPVDLSQRFAGRYYTGIIIPRVRGSMAVLGHPDEALEPVVDRLERGLRWTL